MTSDGRAELLHIAKTIGPIVTTMMLVGGLAVSLVLWVSRVQTQPEAEAQHMAIRSEIQAATIELHNSDVAIDAKASTASSSIKEIGRDVRTIKCLLLSPSTKAKARCGLE
jgi:hypothetical protein